MNWVKRTLRLSEVKAGVIGAHRRRIFNKALRDFSENPWSALNAGSDVLDRLVRGWGQPMWSANSEYLSTIIEEFTRTDGPVLECGSGLSTIVLGILGGATDREIWALEHNNVWAEKVERVFQKLQLTSVTISVNPLRDYDDFAWYDPPLDVMPSNFSLVICDGPPGDGRGGRYGFLPIMQAYLDDRVTILLDDFDRQHEKDTAKAWAETLRATVEVIDGDERFAAIRVEPPTPDPGADRVEGLPAVTVGIPAFNSEATIAQSIDSILSQSYENVLLLVSDNCSNDKTQEICLDRVRSDARMRYFRQTRNIGVFENYNALFRQCNTEYFKWQSSSDYCDSGTLAACVDVLKRCPDVVLVCPQVWLERENGELTQYSGDFGLEMDGPAARFKYLCDNIRLSNLFNGVVRAEALGDTHLNRLFHGSDVVLLAELALQGKFVLLPDRLWYRRMTPSSASLLHAPKQRADFFAGAGERVGKLVTWKMISSLFVAVVRSRTDFKAKLSCVTYLMRRVYWARRALYQELFS